MTWDVYELEAMLTEYLLNRKHISGLRIWARKNVIKSHLNLEFSCFKQLQDTARLQTAEINSKTIIKLIAPRFIYRFSRFERKSIERCVVKSFINGANTAQILYCNNMAEKILNLIPKK